MSSFDRLAAVCEKVAAAPGRFEKTALVADYLRGLDPLDQRRALRFLAGQPVETKDGRKLALGHAVLREAVIAASGFDLELVRLCHREVGDTGETISLLMRNHAGERRPLSLAEAEQWYLRIYQKRQTAARVELLTELYRAVEPLTLRYVVKVPYARRTAMSRRALFARAGRRQREMHGLLSRGNLVPRGRVPD